ncbi:MAG TPA: phosphatase domain-containing protein [Longimicrobiaceae bacterium]|nr:phosphatase domain-containing protein [Longimicrobiaceae bacterium]
MDRWKRTLGEVAHRLEKHVDRARERVAEAFPPDRNDVRIEPYRGYGTPERLYLHGRVLRGSAPSAAGERDHALLNLANMIQRFESDEVPGARVAASLGGRTWQAVTGEEGYFELWMEPDPPLAAGSLWHEVALELPGRTGRDGGPIRATGHVLVPPPESRFGVISDLDDTVIRTGATTPLRMARTVLLGNARTRSPFPGVAAFYRALQHGAGRTGFNPLFYVSSSPWNLYDLLTEFLELRKIPLGPLMLRDWGISEGEVLPTGHAGHKLEAIRRIMELYPNLPFVLLGDSGQEDPEIYHRVVHDYPSRILAVYIRSVHPAAGRADAVRALAEEVAHAGSTLVLTDDTVAAAEHAAAEGWIPADTLAEIGAESERDESGSGPVV